MADYAEINSFPPELSRSGDKYFHLRNYSEYSEYTSGFFFCLLIFTNHRVLDVNPDLLRITFSLARFLFYVIVF